MLQYSQGNSMEHGFNHIDEYNENRPHFGSYNLRFDLHDYLIESQTIYDSPNAKFSGHNDFNRFNSVSKDTKKYLAHYWNNEFNLDYDWTWEYFHSGEPAGLHTDYLSFPNSWKPNKDEITHDCFIVLGIIIPLEWTCKQPYTINYNHLSEVPRKLKFRKGEMRYQDNDEVLPYRDNFVYDEEVLKHNPQGTEYYKEYADLTIHSTYKWKVGTATVFDTRRWHSSSWFLKDKMLPDKSTEYKRSIIGFASIDVDRKGI
tara:strand:- start:1137 stop:1910 length:774 start_codon:yes stop_codon:yes gene_type:complete